MTARVLIRGLIVLVLATVAAPRAWQALAETPASANRAAVAAPAPLLFIENVGQFPPAARFQVWGGGEDALWLTDDGVWLTVRETGHAAGAPAGASRSSPAAGPGQAVAVRLAFVEAAARPTIEPFAPAPTTVSYFLGDDPTAWRSAVPVWGGVRYHNLYPEVDLVIDGAGGQWRWRWEVTGPAGAAALDRARLRVDGAAAVGLADGRARLTTTLGERTLGLPAAPAGGAPTLDGGEIVRPVSADGRLDDRDRAAFSVSSDLRYGTLLGGASDDFAFAVAVDAGGFAYLTGSTASAAFPTTAGVVDTSHNGGDDVFVAKLDPAASGAAGLVYCTFLGGGLNDTGYGIAVDGGGAAVVTGSTEGGFPTTAGAYDTDANGGRDIFLTRLNANGTSLLYGTLLGGSGNDVAQGLALDGTGKAHLVGATASANFPTTTNAYDTSYSGGPSDAFMAKIDPAGGGAADLLYGTFLGGGGEDYGYGLALSGASVVVTGYTLSNPFPTTAGAYDTSPNGGADVFIARLNPAGGGVADLLYGTMVGGTGDDFGQSLAVAGGSVYVTGFTAGSGFPTTAGAFDTSPNGGSDLFVIKLNLAGGGTADLVYGTLVGGTGLDIGYGLVVDGGGQATVAGMTTSLVFPTTSGAFDTTSNGDQDAVLLRLNGAGSGLVYSSVVGGDQTDRFQGLALDGAGRAVLAAISNSPAFPLTSGAFDGQPNGLFDAALVVLAPDDTAPEPTPTPTATLTPTVTPTATPVGATKGHLTWYFAEGYTGAGFDEYLTILNPNASPAAVTITYYLSTGATPTVNLTVGATSRSTVSVHGTTQGVGRGQAVSARVASTNGVGIIVERPMYFTYNTTVTGGHNVMGANAPATSWYFAEGYTGPGFDQYLTIQNPHASPAPVRITYYLSTGATKTVDLTVAANSRGTVAVHDPVQGVGRNQAVSARVSTTNLDGIVVERPMYFTYNGAVTGGHNVMGATAPATSWYFAEGYTGPGFDQFLTIMNPNNAAAPVTITYYLADGSTQVRSLIVAANSRDTVTVHETTRGVGRDQAVAARVTTSNLDGIVVERPMYFTYNGSVTNITGGHNVMGVPVPAATWYFAEGYTGAGFDEYLTILNPNPTPAGVTITYYLSSGATQTVSLTVTASSRATVAVHGTGQGVGRGQAVAARVETTNPGGIVVERPMYFTYNGTITGGHTVMGAR